MTLKNLLRFLQEITVTVCLLFAVCCDVVRVVSYSKLSNNNKKFNLLNHLEVEHAIFMFLSNFIVKVTYTS